jgi:signal transduction histidine kinase
VLTVLAGFGLALYPAAWLFVPSDAKTDETGGGPDCIIRKAIHDRRGLTLVAAVVPILVAAMLLASALRASWLSNYTSPVAVGVACLILIWRNAPAEERAALERAARPFLSVGRPGRSLWQVALWAVIGAGAAAAGLVLLLDHRTKAVLWPIGGVLLVLAGIVVIFGPWWLRIARDLVVERQARAVAEERADIAARVHDSVLQTLALIQRRAADPARVTALARAQERELRSWLFEGKAPGSLDGEATSFSTGLASIERDVEAAHGIKVEAVTVGDCPLDESVEALLAATREATVNAAKWSGSPTVQIFAEAGADAISVFVRDRGAGFDPAAVSPDRKGVAESIRGRMARAGGSATVKSAPGAGTEVVLELPRLAAGRRQHGGNGR